VLSHAATPRELGRVAQASRTLRAFVAGEGGRALWGDVADRRYGAGVARRTAGLYGGDFREMIRDDNRRGAVLAATLTDDPSRMLKGYWRMNRWNGRLYFYLIAGLEYDRLEEKLYLYIDARGESDLRHPSGSFIRWKFDRRGGKQVANFTSFLQWHKPGHYKGVLEFSLENFHRSPVDKDQLIFVFANTTQWGDYEPVDLFEWDGARSIEEVMPKLEGFHYSLRQNLKRPGKDRPFADDTDAVERERWQSHVPNWVMRQERPRRWFV